MAVIRVETQGPVASIILCNPKKRNAMGVAFQEELTHAFQQVQNDESVRAVILKAEGASFCAGLDLAEIAFSNPIFMTLPAPAASKPALLNIIRSFQEVITRAEKCVKPVIAAIQGHCIGGGLDLAAACDIRLASADALFSLREPRVGILADLGSLQRLPYIIGEGHTRRLAFTGEDIDARTALEIGLVNALHDSVEKLWEAAEAMAAAIARNAPLAVQASKEVLNYNRGRPVADSLEYVAARNAAIFPSEDLLEALNAFMSKREPDFKGR